MTKDEITKSLTITTDTNEPSGLMLDWVSDSELSITAPSGNIYTLNAGINFFSIAIGNGCTLYGNKLKVSNFETCYIMVYKDGNIVANIFVL